MARCLYALLVGINEYPDSVTNLNGCINDMQGWLEYFQIRAQKTNCDFKPLVLKNEAATRQAIITGFTEHLTQAQQNDQVVFFFGGHGSQEPGQEACGQSSDEKNQTLVCWDSREEGGWDLADKELSNLIAEVAKNDPQITVILDSCLSVSVTRDEELRERQVSPRYDKRPVSSYFSVERSLQDGTEARPVDGVFQLHKGRHILLSACHETQTAKETYLNGEYHGVFSTCMQEVLSNTPREMTYLELLAKVKHAMAGKVSEQSPQLEVIEGDINDRQCFFLSKDRQSDSDGILALSFDDGHWCVNSSSVHGWHEGTKPTDIELAIFPFTSAPKDIKQGIGQLATAQVTEVLSTFSKVMPDSQMLDSKVLYKALITKAPLPALTIFLRGNNVGVQALRKSLAKINTNRVTVREVDSLAQATVVFQAAEKEYGIFRGPLLGEPMQAPMATFTYMLPKAPDITDSLAHIARWLQFIDLKNPKPGTIPRNGLQLQLVHNGKILTGPEVHLEYQAQNGQWDIPEGKLQLVNNTSMRLYCGVFELLPTFSIDAELFEAGGVWIEPNETLDVLELMFEIPQEFLSKGVVNARNLYKLIASTKEFDVHGWHQGWLSDSERFSRRKQTFKDDWMTQELWVRNVYPNTSPNGLQMVDLDGEIDLQKLADSDEDSLFKELGELARSPKVVDRGDDSFQLIMPKNLEHDTKISSRVFGQEVLMMLSPKAYKLLCSPIEGNGELAAELTKLMDQKTTEAATKAMEKLGYLLVNSLGLPQQIAFRASSLLIRKIAHETSDLICERWQKSLSTE